MIKSGNLWVSDQDDYFINYFKACDVFERENIDTALTFVKKFDVMVDGGAHVGSWSRYLQDKFNLVAAFEPQFENYECLVKNAHGCVLFPFGLSDKISYGDLSSGNNSGCWHVVEGHSIKLIPLPDFGALDLLKLDVEGHELLALKGAMPQLVKYRPIVMIEEKILPHKPLNYDARNLLIELGYKELARINRDVIFGH